MAVARLLPDRKRWEMFIKGALDDPDYLRDGDLVTASGKSADGRIDLGLQSQPGRSWGDRMSMPAAVSVLIVGPGPAGLTLANLLGREVVGTVPGRNHQRKMSAVPSACAT
jgi:NADPH-dependent 2,4-dienoyl-CoA reductase/sulfur reductase-like enzyme